MITYIHKLAYAVLIALVTATGIFGSSAATGVISSSASPNLAGGAIWYVAASGDDFNDCATTTTPCASINGAIGKAVAGDSIYVATGTYLGNGTEVVLVDRDISLSGGWDSDFSSQTGYSTINGQDMRRSITINSGITVNIEWFIVEGGSADIGGGIVSDAMLTINHSIIRNNNASSSSGGGIYVGSQDSLIVNDSEISGNTAKNYGGGIYGTTGSIITINRSAINGNQSVVWGGGGVKAYGTLKINNSTVSGNRSLAGGGIQSNESAEIYSSTVSNNLAIERGGGIDLYSGTVILQNSIIANNLSNLTAPDCRGTITSLGYNLIGNTHDCTLSSSVGNLLDIDPLLGPLMGSPGYHPLSIYSPAADAGDPAGCTGSAGPLTTDQRGAVRVWVCDIGAYEYTSPGSPDSVQVIGGTPQRAFPSTDFRDPLKAVVLDTIGSPVPGISVTFTAPASGPGGTFSASSTNETSVVTDDHGVATTSTFTANSSQGTYNVLASVSGVASPAEFSLANQAWYVSTSGNDAHDCQSPSSTCASINGVLVKPEFITGDPVRIAAGTYTGTGDEVVHIDKGAFLSGGWDTAFTGQTGTSIVDGENSRLGITVDWFVTASMEYFTVQNGYGGGVANYGTLTTKYSTVRANQGGGIYNQGDLRIVSSTINNNSSFYGGGISNGSGTHPYPAFTKVFNSTISGNVGRYGGGIANGGLSTLIINNTTIIKNSGSGSSSTTGGINNDRGGLVKIKNSIVARNIYGDCNGVTYSLGYNLLGRSRGCRFYTNKGDLKDLRPVVGDLQDNGGPTWTHALKAGSPALEAGSPRTPGSVGNACLAADQRGVTRPVGTRCDIGAVEANNINLSIPIAPTDIITDPTPTYEWSVVPRATHYQIQVRQGTEVVLSRIYTSECAPPFCSRTPKKTPAPYIKHKWRVRAKVDGVWEPWSAYKSFKIILLNFYSDFNTTHPRWSPVNGTWVHENSMYYTSSGLFNKATSIKYKDAYKNGVYTVRMLRNGCNTCAQRIIIRGTPRPLDRGSWNKAYYFQYVNYGFFSIYVVNDSKAYALRDWTFSEAINRSTTTAGKWNTLKVVFKGNRKQFYINCKLVATEIETTLDGGKIGIGFYKDDSAGNKLILDWARFKNGILSDLLLDFPIEGVTVPGGTIDRSPE